MAEIRSIYKYDELADDEYYPVYGDPREKCEDAFIKTVSLLDTVLSTQTEDIPAILWFYRANRLATHLASLGLRNEALQLCFFSDRVIATLSQSTPTGNCDFFQSDLAMSRLNLSIRLSEAGRREEALELNEKAVSMYRSLADVNSYTFFTHELAGSLQFLSNCLRENGEKEEALKRIQEATSITDDYQENSFTTAGCAGILHDLAIHLSNMGKGEEALLRIQDAVQLHRNSGQHQDFPNHELARSLVVLSSYLPDSWQKEEALDEAWNICDTLAEEHPRVITPQLTNTLRDLSRVFGSMEKRQRALDCIDLALNLRRKQNTGTFDHEIASLLQASAIFLPDNHLEERKENLEEAAMIYQRLAKQGPHNFTPQLANTFHGLSLTLRAMGRTEEALDYIQKATHLRRRPAEQDLDTFHSNLASSLKLLSNCLSDCGKNKEALAEIQESTALFNKLSRKYPDSSQKEFVDSLKTLHKCLTELGVVKDAQLVSKRIDAISRRMEERAVQSSCAGMDELSLCDTTERPRKKTRKQRLRQAASDTEGRSEGWDQLYRLDKNWLKGTEGWREDWLKGGDWLRPLGRLDKY